MGTQERATLRLAGFVLLAAVVATTLSLSSASAADEPVVPPVSPTTSTPATTTTSPAGTLPSSTTSPPAPPSDATRPEADASGQAHGEATGLGVMGEAVGREADVGLGVELATNTLVIPVAGAYFPYGQPWPLTIVVTNVDGVPNPRPTGTLTLYRSADGGTTWDVAAVEPLVDNQNPFPTDSPAGYVYFEETADLPPGQYDYYAEYAGEPPDPDPAINSFAPSTSNLVNVPNGITVEYGSQTAATPSWSFYQEGEDVVVDVEVTSNPAGGPVQEGEVLLYRDGVLVQTAPLAGGVAQLEDVGVPVGTFTYWVTFEPDSFAQYGSTSSSFDVTVEVPPIPTVDLYVDPLVAPEGTTFTLTAEVMFQEYVVPSGTVRFFAEGLFIADRPAATPTLDVVPPIGFHRYTAQYLTDGEHPTSEVSEEVLVAATGMLPSDVEVVADEPVAYGDDFTVRAEVIDLGVLPWGSREGPTGSVELFDGAVGSLGTAPLELVDDPDEGPGRHVAVLEVTRDLPPGDREIWAEYSGESSHPSGFPYEPTGSLAVVQEVTTGAVEVQLEVSSAPLADHPGGECVTLLAKVVPTMGSAPLTGGVVYVVNGEAAAPQGTPRCPVGGQGLAGPTGSSTGSTGLGHPFGDTALVAPRFASPMLPVGVPYTVWLPNGSHTFGAAFDGDQGYASTAAADLPFLLGALVPGPPNPNPPAGPGEDPATPSSPTDPDDQASVVAVDDRAVAQAPDEADRSSSFDELLLVGAAAAAADGDRRDGADDDATAVAQAASSPSGGGGGSARFDAARSRLVDSIPTNDLVDWSMGQVAAALWLTLIIILLVELPSTVVNATLEDHHDRVVAPFSGVLSWLAVVEERIAAWPNAVVLLVFACVSGLIGSQLDPGFGVDATSLVLLAAMISTFALITLVLEGMRVPYLHRRTGVRSRLHLFPFVLVMGVVLVVVCRIFEFQPGYVFGVSVALLLSDGIEDDDDARSLAISGGALLGVALVAWFLWNPIAEQAMGADPSLRTLFFDAFLSTTWVMSLQVVLFEFSSLRGMHGSKVRRWRFGVWAAIYGTAGFLLVKMVLHPSAGRWGGLPSNTFFGMLAVFVVIFLASLLFWAWFNLRPGTSDRTPPKVDAQQAS